MPELPEVETVVRGIRPKLVGRTICHVKSSRLMIRPKRHFHTRLTGQTVQALDRHGKWMFLRLGNGETLVMHLGMTGVLSVEATTAPVALHTHLRLGLDDGKEEMRFCDPRRFGELVLCTAAEWHARFQQLGPDALQITPKQLHRVFEKTSRNLKAVLLDQRSVAGIGNIYADEVLHAAGLAPTTRGNEVSRQEAERLVRCIRRILKRSISANGTTIRNYVTGEGVPGEFQARLRVYGRANQPCKTCSASIVLSRDIVSGRATYWCPNCQAS